MIIDIHCHLLAKDVPSKFWWDSYVTASALLSDRPEEKIREKIDTVRRLVVKAEECVGCGVCVARCKEGALMLDRDRVEIEVGRCIHCGRCIDPCPAVSYGDTTFDF